MNSLAAFAQRTEIVTRFRRALLIFWLPLVTAAAVPAIVVAIGALLDMVIALRWPILMLLAFLFFIAIAYAVKEFQKTENEFTWETARKERRFVYATYTAIVIGCIIVLGWSVIIAPRPRPDVRDASHKPPRAGVDLDCRNCGGPDVDMDSPNILRVPPTPPPIEKVPLPRPRPNPYRL